MRDRKRKPKPFAWVLVYESLQFGLWTETRFYCTFKKEARIMRRDLRSKLVSHTIRAVDKPMPLYKGADNA
jgi:hypothetical protein